MPDERDINGKKEEHPRDVPSSPAPEQRKKEHEKEGVGQWVQRQFLKHALPWMPGGMMAFPDAVTEGTENAEPMPVDEQTLGDRRVTDQILQSLGIAEMLMVEENNSEIVITVNDHTYRDTSREFFRRIAGKYFGMGNETRKARAYLSLRHAGIDHATAVEKVESFKTDPHVHELQLPRNDVVKFRQWMPLVLNSHEPAVIFALLNAEPATEEEILTGWPNQEKPSKLNFLIRKRLGVIFEETTKNGKAAFTLSKDFRNNLSRFLSFMEGEQYIRLSAKEVSALRSFQRLMIRVEQTELTDIRNRIDRQQYRESKAGEEGTVYFFNDGKAIKVRGCEYWTIALCEGFRKKMMGNNVSEIKRKEIHAYFNTVTAGRPLNVQGKPVRCIPILKTFANGISSVSVMETVEGPALTRDETNDAFNGMRSYGITLDILDTRNGRKTADQITMIDINEFIHPEALVALRRANVDERKLALKHLARAHILGGTSQYPTATAEVTGQVVQIMDWEALGILHALTKDRLGNTDFPTDAECEEMKMKLPNALRTVGGLGAQTMREYIEMIRAAKKSFGEGWAPQAFDWEHATPAMLTNYGVDPKLYAELQVEIWKQRHNLTPIMEYAQEAAMPELRRRGLNAANQVQTDLAKRFPPEIRKELENGSTTTFAKHGKKIDVSTRALRLFFADYGIAIDRSDPSGSIRIAVVEAVLGPLRVGEGAKDQRRAVLEAHALLREPNEPKARWNTRKYMRLREAFDTEYACWMILKIGASGEEIDGLPSDMEIVDAFRGMTRLISPRTCRRLLIALEDRECKADPQSVMTFLQSIRNDAQMEYMSNVNTLKDAETVLEKMKTLSPTSDTWQSRAKENTHTEENTANVPKMSEVYAKYEGYSETNGENGRKEIKVETSPELETQVIDTYRFLLQEKLTGGEAVYDDIVISPEYYLTVQRSKKEIRLELHGKSFVSSDPGYREDERTRTLIADHHLSFQNDNEWVFNHRYVDPSIRSQGIGSMLFSMLNGILRERAKQTKTSQVIRLSSVEIEGEGVANVRATQVGVLLFSLRKGFVYDSPDDQKKAERILAGDPDLRLCDITYLRPRSGRVQGMVFSMKDLLKARSQVQSEKLSQFDQAIKNNDIAKAVHLATNSEPLKIMNLAYGPAMHLEVSPREGEKTHPALRSRPPQQRARVLEAQKIVDAEAKKPIGNRDYQDVLEQIRKMLGKNGEDGKEVFSAAEIEHLVNEGVFGEEIVRVAAEERTALEGLVQQDVKVMMEKFRVDPGIVYRLGNVEILGKIAVELGVKVSDGTNVGKMQEEITTAIKGKK